MLAGSGLVVPVALCARKDPARYSFNLAVQYGVNTLLRLR
jgi:hypothetical protein